MPFRGAYRTMVIPSADVSVTEERRVHWGVFIIVGSLLLAGIAAIVPFRASAASLQAQVLGPHSVRLDWDPECVNGGPSQPCQGYQTDQYAVYLKNGTYQAYWEYVDTVRNVAVTSYTVIGLEAETTYQFYVAEGTGWWSFPSNVVTVTTEPKPIDRPSFSITKPGVGETIQAGTPLAIEWSITDDRDRPEDLIVYLNYSGPASGPIAGPISGQTTRLTWTVPPALRGTGFRISGIAFDSDGRQRPAESQEFTITGSTLPPSGDGDLTWKISTAILTVAVAGLTAGFILAVRIQLTEWFRRSRENRRQRASPRGPLPPQ